MKKPDLAKIREFLNQTPVLLEHVCAPASLIPQEKARRKALLAGAPLKAGELLHRKLSREFERRLNALPEDRFYLVIDFTRDNVFSASAIRETVTRKYRALAREWDDSSLSPETARKRWMALDMFGAGAHILLDLLSGLRRLTSIIIPGDITPSMPQNISGWIFASPAQIRTDIPISAEEYSRMTHYHEGFGHGTQEVRTFYGDRTHEANAEMRADIAAMIGILRDTGNEGAVKFQIFARDLRALRSLAMKKPLGRIADYANGRELRKAFADIGCRKLSRIDDCGILRLTDEIFTPLLIHETGMKTRRNSLRDAFRLASEARDGKAETLAGLAERKPERLRNALEFLQNCMDAHAFFFTPKPVMP